MEWIIGIMIFLIVLKTLSGKTTAVENKESPFAQFFKLEKLLLSRDDFYGVFGDDERNSIEKNCKSFDNSIYCFTLALIYMYGINCSKNIAKAEQLLLNFKDADNPVSRKAYMYLFIIEEDRRNLKKGIKYLEQGSALGDAGASAELGTFYAEGVGVKQNPEKALALWSYASNQGIKGMAENIETLKAELKKSEKLEIDPEMERIWNEMEKEEQLPF